jgi:DNA-binding IscR family transcriptional regulator
VSPSTGYGLLAVAYIAQNKDQGLILSQDVSKKYNISLEYLLKILQQLVRVSLMKFLDADIENLQVARSLKEKREKQ